MAATGRPTADMADVVPDSIAPAPIARDWREGSVAPDHHHHHHHHHHRRRRAAGAGGCCCGISWCLWGLLGALALLMLGAYGLGAAALLVPRGGPTPPPPNITTLYVRDRQTVLLGPLLIPAPGNQDVITIIVQVSAARSPENLR